MLQLTLQMEMTMVTRYKLQRVTTRRIRIAPSARKAWHVFIHEAADWTVALTANIKRFHENQPISIQHMMQAMRHFLRVLDYRCFGRNRVKRGAFVGSVVVYGWGTYNDHPHAHLALVCPKGLSDAAFEEHIRQACAKTMWFEPKPDIRKYRDVGWSDYMIGHDPENLDTELMRISTKQPEF